MDSNAYHQRGVSSDKAEVHQAIQRLDKGLFPNAFCKVLPDFLANSPDHGIVMHADTAGTKSVLAYMYYIETGDSSVWKGIAQDALVMNLDDMACAGLSSGFVVSSLITRNKHLIPGEILKYLIDGTADLLEEWKNMGIDIHHAGGETADAGDVVRTIDVGFTVTGRLLRSSVVSVNVPPNCLVVGLGSYGQARFETEYNSGIGCNGLTSARHDLLAANYTQKFPETFAPQSPSNLTYCGKFQLSDIEPITGMPVGKLLLSPTRPFFPVINAFLPLIQNEVYGMIHLTGGAHSKALKFLKGIRVVKDNPLPVPPIFNLIQSVSRTSDTEMHTVFNMGTRLEVYCSEQAAKTILDTAAEFNIPAGIVGYTEAATQSEIRICRPEKPEIRILK
jgi:phosphoribosylformylglycinamidine cyclo-ligase